MNKDISNFGVGFVLTGLAIIVVGVGLYLTPKATTPVAPVQEVTVTEDLGVVVSSQVVATSFNESPKTQVITTKASLVIGGVHSFVIGDTSTIDYYNTGVTYFCTSRVNYCHRILW